MPVLFLISLPFHTMGKQMSLKLSLAPVGEGLRGWIGLIYNQQVTRTISIYIHALRYLLGGVGQSLISPWWHFHQPSTPTCQRSWAMLGFDWSLITITFPSTLHSHLLGRFHWGRFHWSFHWPFTPSAGNVPLVLPFPFCGEVSLVLPSTFHSYLLGRIHWSIPWPFN